MGYYHTLIMAALTLLNDTFRALSRFYTSWMQVLDLSHGKPLYKTTLPWLEITGLFFLPDPPKTNKLKYLLTSNLTLSQSIMNLVKIPVLFHFRAGFECGSIESFESLVAPSLNTTNNICLLQSQPLLFSCRAARPGVIRVCPCRSYRVEQVALCETC